MVDPSKDSLWKDLRKHVKTDAVHQKDRLNPDIETPGEYNFYYNSDTEIPGEYALYYPDIETPGEYALYHPDIETLGVYTLCYLNLVNTLPGEPGQFHLWPGIGQGSYSRDYHACAI